MKHKGCTNYMAEERDEDIMRIFNEVASDPSLPTVTDIYKEVARRPSRQYWVTTRRAYDMVKRLSRGSTLDERMYPTRRQMYEDIWARAKELMAETEGMKLYDAVQRVVYSTAPCPYMTYKSIKKVVIRQLKKRR